MTSGDTCAEHATGELLALRADPHDDLTLDGPGFFERQDRRAPDVDLRSLGVVEGGELTRYGRAALDGALDDLRESVAAGAGRNNALNAFGFRVGQLVAAGHIDAAWARGELVELAEGMCPDERTKARLTVRRALIDGIRRSVMADGR